MAMNNGPGWSGSAHSFEGFGGAFDSGVVGPSCSVEGVLIKCDLSRETMGVQGRALRRAVWEGFTHRGLIRHGYTRWAFYVGHAVPGDCAWVCGRPTQRPRDGAISDMAPARSGSSAWRDFATGRTAPGAQRGAASPTHLRSLAGGEVRHSSGGVRQIYLSRLRVASPRTGRHGRAARPLAGGTPTFSDFPSRPPLTTHTPSFPLPPSRLPFAACPTSCTRSAKPPRSRWRTWRARYYAPATAPSSTRSSQPW